MSELLKSFGNLTSTSENMNEEVSEIESQRRLELEDETAQTPENEATTSQVSYKIPKLTGDPSWTTKEPKLKSIEEEEIKGAP